MRNYIFITNEGYTFQPNSSFVEPEIENCQVLGFGVGNDSIEAFNNFKNVNSYLTQTTFDEVYCYELTKSKSNEVFSLKS